MPAQIPGPAKIGGAMKAQVQKAASAAAVSAAGEARATAKSAMDQVGLPAEGLLGGDEATPDNGTAQQAPAFDPAAYRAQVKSRDAAAIRQLQGRLKALVTQSQAQAAQKLQQEQQSVAQMQHDQMAGGTPEELQSRQEAAQKSSFLEGLKRRMGHVGKGKSEKGRAAKG